MARFEIPAIVLLAAGSCFATTIRVPNDKPTIQAGVNAALNGDTVLVGPGEYVENLVMRGFSISLISVEGPEATTVRPANPGGSVIRYPNRPLPAVTGEVRGFTFKGATDARGISVMGGNSPLITDCIFRENDRGLTLNSSGITVRNCKILSNSSDENGTGLYIEGSNIVISDCTVAHNRGIFEGSTVWIESSADILIERVTAYDNLGTHEGAGFLYVYQSDRVRIINNTVVGNGSPYFSSSSIYISGGANHDIRNNIIAFNKKQCGVRIDASPGVRLEYNNVYGNPGGDYLGDVAGLGSISTDPLFENIDSNDYRLQSNSPCVNRGDPNPFYNDPDFSQNDLGALPLMSGLPMAYHVGVRSETLARVISHRPVFEWKYSDTTLGEPALYEFEVGDDNDWTIAEKWSSGEVSATSSSAEYDGLPLVDGLNYYLRVRVSNGRRWSSWVESVFHMNSLPSVPEPVKPVSTGDAICFDVKLVVANSTDSDNDSLSYDFELYADPGMTSLCNSIRGARERSEQSHSGRLPALSPETRYWWRARTSDGYEQSAWTTLVPFQTRKQDTLRVPSGYSRIQAALDASSGGEVILVAPGTYREFLRIKDHTVVLKSVGGADRTTLAAYSTISGDLIEANNPNLSFFWIDGFTITNVTNGSAIRIGYGNSVRITSCSILNNSGYDGAGIYCAGADVQIENCNFGDNIAVGSGGAISISGTDVTIQDCEFYRNQARNEGGAINILSTDRITIARNIAWKNGAQSSYGGFVNTSQVSYLTINNNTIVENYAPVLGGGVRVYGGAHQEIRNNIIAFNEGSVGFWIGGVSNDTEDANDIYGNTHGDVSGTSPGQYFLFVDPQFCSRETHDFRLDSNSPCAPENNPRGVLLGASQVGCQAICGDVDGDGVFTSIDVSLLRSYYFMGIPPLHFSLSNADLNCDNQITLSDVLFVTGYFFGFGPTPCCALPPKQRTVPQQTD